MTAKPSACDTAEPARRRPQRARSWEWHAVTFDVLRTGPRVSGKDRLHSTPEPAERRTVFLDHRRGDVELEDRWCSETSESASPAAWRSMGPTIRMVSGRLDGRGH